MPLAAQNIRIAIRPTVAAIQNVEEGRSRPRMTPMSAVAAGSKPTTMAPCEDGTLRSARAVHSGNPTMTPMTISPRRDQELRRGTGTRYPIRSGSAQAAATSERPRPTISPSIVVTAIFVAGRVSENAATPKEPQIKASDRAGLAIGLAAIALSLNLMEKDNSTARVIQMLRALIKAAAP